MNNKPILIVSGEPNSTFFEILLKALKKKYNSPIILIGAENVLKFNINFFKSKIKVNLINEKNINYKNLNLNVINLINVDYKDYKRFDKISKNSKKYISKCFKIAIKLLKKKITDKLINGPISKKNYLNKKYPGITEYLSKKTKTKNYAMIIFNEKLSVSPITTHLPLKNVSKKITKKLIVEKVVTINNFYKKFIKLKPKIAITGLNPHCESFHKINEEKKIIIPAIRILRKQRININGPYSSDTIFIKDIRKKFDMIIGMYHDQVLGPMKTIFEFDAINITAGLPFVRVSPDHGPNEKMLGKNISDPKSLIKAIKFLDK